MISLKLSVNRWKRYSRKIPTNFSQLTRKQYLQFVYLLFKNKSIENLENLPVSFKIDFTKYLINVPDKVLYTIGGNGIIEIIEKIDKVFKPTYHPVLKNILVGMQRLHLPQEKLQDLNFMEFCLAESFYQSILEGKGDETENLNHLLSILCKPHKNGKRIEYNQELENKIFETVKFYNYESLANAKNISRAKVIFYGVAPILKYGIFFNYLQQRKALVLDYPSAFKEGDKQGPDLTSSYGWLAAAHDLAEAGTFGNFDKLSITPLHTVLHHISYKNDHNQEVELRNRLENGQH